MSRLWALTKIAWKVNSTQRLGVDSVTLSNGYLSMPDIKFLNPVDIREVWKREDTDFTPWLANEEPLKVLLEECGIDLGTDFQVRTELKIPGVNRKLDLYVQTESMQSIAIENQYSEADHDHFTRALAYAVGLDTNVVIVVAENHREEFVELSRYLNDAASAYGEKGISVFLVKVVAHSSDSEDAYYPSFELISGPEEWKAVVAKSVSTAGESRDVLLYDFHDRLLPHLRMSTGLFNKTNPAAEVWKAASIGIKGVNIRVLTSQNDTVVGCWIHTGSSDANLAALEVLEKDKDELQGFFPEHELSWTKRKTCYVEVRVEDVGYATNPTEDELKQVSLLAKVFAERLNSYFDELKSSILEVMDNEDQQGKWSKEELGVAVDIYIEMLAQEEQGKPYVKVDYLRDGVLRLPTRTLKSLELRMQNISAVLDSRGEIWIDGYKPARNVGANVSAMIEEILESKIE